MAIKDLDNSAVQTAGDIKIEELVIVSTDGAEIDIRGHIGELNLYEDLYRTGLYGNLLVIDNINLSQIIELSGDEYLRIKMSTPSMQATIHKTFKVYSITDRTMLTDTGKQSYIMHYCSPELFIDALSPIYKTFSGRVDDVAKQIFANYVATSRNGNSNDFSPLVVVGSTENQVKFTSPGWHPMTCINWLASRAIGSGYKNPGYLFFETNKSFYFANIEQIIDNAVSSKKYYQDYYYRANNLTGYTDGQYGKDVDFEYKLVEDMKVIETFNALKNSQNGYLANRLFTFDVVTKKYNVWDYDHVNNYKFYKHLEDIDGKSIPPFPQGSGSIASGALRSPAGFNQVHLQHKTLYTGFENNVTDRIKDIVPRRTSTLNELLNFKLEITVPGRTDIEVGSIVKFHYPDASPRDETDTSKAHEDQQYSGFYLITAIRHKVTLLKHMMILELVKDSYKARGNQ